jgi:NAD(P)-dependent dehydrogenase (short-subunit alcohol dehydrogenase family)
MTKEAEVARMFDEVGAFDHLVSASGTLPPGDPIDREMDVVRRFVDNKLIGAVMLARYAVRTLRTEVPLPHFGNQQGSAADSRRLRRVRNCWFIRLFRPRPSAGAGPRRA